MQLGETTTTTNGKVFYVVYSLSISLVMMTSRNDKKEDGGWKVINYLVILQKNKIQMNILLKN